MARNDAIGVSDESLEKNTNDRIYFISCESTLRYQNWIGRGFATIMIRLLPSLKFGGFPKTGEAYIYI